MPVHSKSDELEAGRKDRSPFTLPTAGNSSNKRTQIWVPTSLLFNLLGVGDFHWAKPRLSKDPGGRWSWGGPGRAPYSESKGSRSSWAQAPLASGQRASREKGWDHS